MQKSVNFWDFWDDLEMGLAIFGCGGIEIIGFGLVCGFVINLKRKKVTKERKNK